MEIMHSNTIYKKKIFKKLIKCAASDGTPNQKTSKEKFNLEKQNKLNLQIHFYHLAKATTH